MGKKTTKPFWEMNKAELAEATREFDQEMIMDEFRPLGPEKRALWERLKRRSPGFTSDTVPEVRILPMDSGSEFEGRRIKDVQARFFLGKLVAPERSPPGKYHYREKGLKAKRGTLVLFQYAGKIIASATFERAERRPQGAYKGALYFDPASVRVFEPVGLDVVHRIWPRCKRFSRVKWRLDPKKYPAFEQQLTSIQSPQAS